MFDIRFEFQFKNVNVNQKTKQHPFQLNKLDELAGGR